MAPALKANKEHEGTAFLLKVAVNEVTAIARLTS